MTACDAIALEFLGRLERAECSLLSWGVVDGAFNEEELLQRAEEFLESVRRAGGQEAFEEGWALVEYLLDRHLLWQVTQTDKYRTRMAESVRLFARLRQIFPDAQHKAWRTAPRLVADYRFLQQRRVYPVRDITVGAAIDALRSNVHLSPCQFDLIKSLLRAGSSDERLLSGFQLRASERILRWSKARQDRPGGTVVCAGTGSGKTLAFYLPAFAAIAERLPGDPWVKCLAIYPRNELLKDQLREALANARRVATALAVHGRRKIVLGALFGGAPWNAADVAANSRSDRWRRVKSRGSDGYECPFVRCPECGEFMAWLDEDLNRGTERLVCPKSGCRTEVGADEIRLTRERMIAEPPDILFTTTEMLNKRMSSRRYSRLFGMGMPREQRPEFVLLDEVHSYEGVSGAQVALLLRRWRHLVDARPHVVGLSATLADAPRFFSELTGLGPGDVTEVSPEAGEFRAEGAEYLLAIRGDPSTGTSLLSTSIQAAMLLRRVLDANAGGVGGSRVFAFTDNLDVINRFYHNLADAEGLNSWGRPDGRKPSGSLANLRSSTLPDARDRLDAGQSWDLAEEIGHVLAPGRTIRVARTSSQDAGVDPNAEVIVATSSLEVGFDDPDVGAVLQHKAPQSGGGFLQRKGRAGRVRGMRPWTVVVLSDYGRDRIAYQAYDQLFSPVLPPRHLPIQNRSVLRMQATFALLDWLAQRLPSDLSPDPWADLSKPSKVTGAHGNSDRKHTLYASLLRNLLHESQLRDEFEGFLVRALGISPDTAKSLLWEPPRSVVMGAAPTLLRQLERDWRRAGEAAPAEYSPWAPLPGFLPGALFSDLQLPEVRIQTGSQAPSGTDEDQMMPITHALREFAPGRVSRRFGVAHKGVSHWVDPGADVILSIDRFCPASDRQEVGHLSFIDDAGSHRIRFVRPHVLAVVNPPANVQQSSNATLEWRTEVVPSGMGSEGALPDGSPWRELLTSLRVHSHGQGAPVEVRRCAPTVQVMEARKGAPVVERRVAFVAERPDGTTEAVGVGFVADVDAVQVVFRYPTDLTESVAKNERLCRGLRLQRFRDLLRENPTLDGLANRFQRDWLVQVYLSAVTAEALSRNCDLREAEAAVVGRDTSVPIARVLETILQINDPDDDDLDGSGPATANHREPPRRLMEVSDLLARVEVQAALHEASPALWESLDKSWEAWLRTRFRATLGAALVEGARQLCPQMDADALVVDVDARPQFSEERSDEFEDELWLTEVTIGGGGFVEEFHERYAEDPRRFLRLVDAALLPSDLESVGHELQRIVTRLASGPGHDATCSEIVEDLRTADSHAASARAVKHLRAHLAGCGIQPTPTLMVSLNARLVRPGTSQKTDDLTSRLLVEWDAAEMRLGVEIDVRVLALAKSGESTLEHAIDTQPPPGSEEAIRSWRYSVLCGMLWARGTHVRAQTLTADNPFTQHPETDRMLLLGAIMGRQQVVDVESMNWFERASAALVADGVVVLVSSDAGVGALVGALLKFGTQSIDAGAVLVYARVVGVSRDGGCTMATLELPEALQ